MKSPILVFVDAGVDNYQQLFDGVVGEAQPFLLNTATDGIQQIDQILQQYPGHKTVHIISHGAPGCLYLGNTQLSLDTLKQYAPQLQQWDIDNLLLYGCHVAAGDAGEELVSKLQSLTGANIAASKSVTGAAVKGGNWELEVNTGKVTVATALQTEVMGSYSGVFNLELEAAFESGQVIVKPAPSADVSSLNSLQASVGATTLKTTKTDALNFQLWSIPEDIDVEDFISRNENNPLIENIEPNYLYTLDSTVPDDSIITVDSIDSVSNDPINVDFNVDSTPNDQFFNSPALMWGLHNTGQDILGVLGTPDADIDAPEAWDIQTGSNDVVVGVLDTGIDYTHPDLVNNMWINTGETPGNGVDDDGNGYVDDVYGYDFFNDDGDPLDGHSHGTHVAGTIGAEGNNGIGVVGVNWDVDLMALKIFADDGSSAGTFNIILAVEYATMMGANLTNNSWGGGAFSSLLSDAITAAGDADSLFVASAGNSATNNDATPYYPASYDLDNIISVASTDNNDNLSSFSQYGATSVDLGAPGTSIASTFPGNQYSWKSGTSMAAPHVSGVAALVLAEDPSLSYQEVKDVILDSTDPISALNGITVTGGRLNAFNALSSLNNPPTDIALSNDTVDENVPDNTIVGTFNTIDPDAGDTFTYELVSGVGDTDNTAFTIDGDQLKINSSPDYETQSSYDIRIQTTDAGGESYQEEFTISVNDLDESSDPVRFDFNADGVADILWRNGSGLNSIWLMDNGGTLNSSVNPGNVGTAWNVAEVADFNADGVADILWRNGTTGANSISLMSSGGTVSSSINPGNVGTAWNVAGVANFNADKAPDFNADGVPDILWRNGTTGANGIWLMDNDGTVSSSVNPGNVGTAWDVAGVADFNDDGVSDILWRNGTTGANSISLMSSGGTVSSNVNPGNVGIAWDVAGVADFNEDGVADILWRNGTTGANSIWLMSSGGTLTSSVNPGSVGTAWDVAGVAHFDDNGVADILWRNGTTGANSIWLMSSGGTLSNSVNPGSVGTAWDVAGM